MFRGLIFLCALSWASSFIANDVFKDLHDCDNYDQKDSHDDHCPFYTHRTQVCGSDGVTYKDFCAFMRVRCASEHNQIHMAARHACDSTTIQNQHSVHVTSTPDAMTKTMPTSTAMPKTKEPTTATVISTQQPVTSTLMPVTSTNGVSVENILDFLCIELSREDCVPELNQVCGSDGFTYRNYCEFQKARCMHRKLKMEQSGSC
ncbi:serine protease inhibitor dipetalogastin-like [Haliotis rubra]|uniref:serine protease inhibitor dipetalogastin-like n=1 Tax=Haliotis rubra TaxID=36100 RepID=UPI001EE630DF|nr:serine protease inhibitor dipetalogastin-like [Haliotis rubra]